MRAFVFVLLSSIFITSCEPNKAVGSRQLVDFITDEENGLKHTVVVGDLVLMVTYRPTDLWVKQELGSAPVKADDVERLRVKYDRFYYFLLSVTRNGKEALYTMDPEGHSALVNTLSFEMNKYVSLSSSASEPIQPTDFMHNRTYGLNNSTDILFAFDRSRSENGKWVQFNLNEFGMGIGNQHFRFSKDDLESVPPMLFN